MNNKTYIPASLNNFTIQIPEIGRVSFINLLLPVLPFIFILLNPITSNQLVNSILGLLLFIILFILLFPSNFNKNKSLYNSIYIYYKRNKEINKYE